MNKKRLALLSSFVGLLLISGIVVYSPAGRAIDSHFIQSIRGGTPPAKTQPAVSSGVAQSVKPIDSPTSSDNAQSFSLTLYETSDQPVNAVQATVVYPADQLRLFEVADSGSFPIAAATDRTPGRLQLARGTTSRTLNGRQPVSTLTFEVIGKAGPRDVTVDATHALLIATSGNQNILPANGTFELR